MFVWPPIPLQPLDDGIDRKFAHSRQVRLGDDRSRRRRLSRWTMNASDGRAAGERPRAGGRRHAGRVDVVLDDDRDAEQRAVGRRAVRALSAARASARAVGLTVMTAWSSGSAS